VARVLSCQRMVLSQLHCREGACVLKHSVVLGVELCFVSELLTYGCLLPKSYAGALETVDCSRLQIASVINACQFCSVENKFCPANLGGISWPDYKLSCWKYINVLMLYVKASVGHLSSFAVQSDYRVILSCTA